MTTKSLAENALWSLATYIFHRGSLMGSAIIIARSIDPAGFASYSYFQLTSAMLASYSALGVGVAASRYFSESRQTSAGISDLPIQTLWFLSWIGSLAIALLVLLLPPHIIGAGLGLPNWLFALGVLVLAADAVPSGAIVGLELFRIEAKLALIAGIIALLGACYAAASASAEAAIVSFIIANTVKTAGDCYLVTKTVGLKQLLQGSWLRRADVRQLATFAGPMVAVTLIASTGSWLLGRVIISGNNGTQSFALYSIGLQWLSLSLLLPGILTRVALPRLIHSAGEVEKSAKADRELVKLGVATTICTAAFVALLGTAIGPWLLDAYGENYTSDRWLIAAFMLAGLLNAPANMIGNAIVARDGQRTWLLLITVWFLVLIGTGIVTKNLGAWSGAVSHGLAALALTAGAALTARRRQLL